ncbi:MAG: hypothetical protein HC942_07320 [Microcoleus sp. SU_5_6]|nr:hypothetical protein [Microcoleus sp. SU_5_6]
MGEWERERGGVLSFKLPVVNFELSILKTHAFKTQNSQTTVNCQLSTVNCQLFLLLSTATQNKQTQESTAIPQTVK